MLFTLITIATFMIVTGVIISGYYWASAESVVTQRLRTLVPNAQSETERKRRRTDASGVERALALVGSYSLGGGDNSVAQRLSVAGIRGSNAVLTFLGIRTVISFGPALLVLIPRVSNGKPLGRTLFLASLVWAIGHLFSNLWLRARATRRARRITEALPDTLDLMVTCLEAGLGVNATIARIGEERASLDDPLGAEFARLSIELRSGRSREDCLRGLGDRNGVEDLKALAGLIIQSDRLGASMAQTLRAHADLLRTKRRQRAEEAARKLPIKMLFPLAVFILPALFIVVGGPAILRLRDLVGMLLQ